MIKIKKLFYNNALVRLILLELCDAIAISGTISLKVRCDSVLEN